MRATLLVALTLLPLGIVCADGGAVIASEIIENRRITVFSDPAFLRAGPADFSVLVQEATTGDPVLNAAVELVVAPSDGNSPNLEKVWLPPCCSMEAENDGAVSATHAAADNKLLYAANVILPTAGDHLLTATISDTNGSISLPIRLAVLGPASPLSTYWPFLAFPPLAIGLFALRQKIGR